MSQASVHTQGVKFAEQRGLPFVTTSAKSNAGIDLAFTTLVDDMLSRRDPDRFPPVRAPSQMSGMTRCLKCCWR